MAAPDVAAESRALKGSIAAAVALGATGIAWGLLTNSSLILLDGAYAFIGVAVSWLLLMVSALVGRGPSKVYPYGREALTPMVVGVQGFVLLATVAYAAFEAVGALLEGGAEVSAGWALLYAALTTAGSVVVWRWLRSAARGSDLVGAEATAWGVSAVLGVGMILGFAILLFAQRSDWTGVTPYIDPVMVLVTCVVLVPAPVRMVRSTFIELLEGAPPVAVQEPVRAAVDETMAEFGLATPEVLMTKIGQKLYVEVDGHAGAEMTIGTEDEIRRALTRRLDELHLDVWLNLEILPWDDDDRTRADDTSFD